MSAVAFTFDRVKLRAFKYLMAYTLPATVLIAFTNTGWLAWLPLLYAFGFIPLMELFIAANPKNLSATEQEMVKADPIYDWLLYAMVPLQYVFLVLFLMSIDGLAVSSLAFWGRSVSMGLMCGVIGINVAHELGHRRSKTEQVLAKLLLITSLYTHFFIEHNFGHHRNVATAEDPASARYNETLFAFWWRSIMYSYSHAWKIQMQMLRKQKKSFWSLNNQMLLFQGAHILILALIGLLIGLKALLGFLIAALMGILLLETVNYIEHYGLSRKKLSDKRYENTSPVHSWNSNHVLGRLVLFELSRHSDHHAHPHKPYPLLSHYSHSPQLPTGYPGMMLLALFPPLFFRIVNSRI